MWGPEANCRPLYLLTVGQPPGCIPLSPAINHPSVLKIDNLKYKIMPPAKTKKNTGGGAKHVRLAGRARAPSNKAMLLHDTRRPRTSSTAQHAHASLVPYRKGCSSVPHVVNAVVSGMLLLVFVAVTLLVNMSEVRVGLGGVRAVIDKSSAYVTISISMHRMLSIPRKHSHQQAATSVRIFLQRVPLS